MHGCATTSNKSAARFEQAYKVAHVSMRKCHTYPIPAMSEPHGDLCLGMAPGCCNGKSREKDSAIARIQVNGYEAERYAIASYTTQLLKLKEKEPHSFQTKIIRICREWPAGVRKTKSIEQQR